MCCIRTTCRWSTLGGKGRAYRSGKQTKCAQGRRGRSSRVSCDVACEAKSTHASRTAGEKRRGLILAESARQGDEQGGGHGGVIRPGRYRPFLEQRLAFLPIRSVDPARALPSRVAVEARLKVRIQWGRANCRYGKIVRELGENSGNPSTCAHGGLAINRTDRCRRANVCGRPRPVFHSTCPSATRWSSGLGDRWT